MDNQIFENTLNSLTEKLGEETVAKVADDLGILKTAQQQALNTKAELEANLEKAKQDRLEMQQANARLLQQIPVGEPSNTQTHETTEAEEHEFDPRTCFDENGNIKR